MHRIAVNGTRVRQALVAIGVMAAAAFVLPIARTSAETAKVLPAPAVERKTFGSNACLGEASDVWILFITTIQQNREMTAKMFCFAHKRVRSDKKGTSHSCKALRNHSLG